MKKTLISFFVSIMLFSVLSAQEKILIVVNQAIFNEMTTEQKEILNAYMGSLVERGNIFLNPIIFEYELEEPPNKHYIKEAAVDFKENILKPAFYEDNITGAILIGELPIALFYLEDYWSDYYEGRSIDIKTFDCDLFFMDLDGEWEDTTGDHVFDSHTSGSGNLYPEIWISRIDPKFWNIAKNDEIDDSEKCEWITKYLNKNINYANRQLCGNIKENLDKSPDCIYNYTKEAL